MHIKNTTWQSRKHTKKTIKIYKKIQFKSKKTTYNKRVASKIEVTDWELKVMVPGMEPIWIAFDWRE